MAKKRGDRSERAESVPPARYDAFLSHATLDKYIAKSMCEKIEQLGACVFRDDRDLSDGDIIPEGIRQALNRSSELLVLLTPNSVNRPWVLLEIGAFWGRRADARIVPVLYNVIVENIPEMIRNVKAIQLNDFDRYLDELSARLSERRRAPTVRRRPKP